MRTTVDLPPDLHGLLTSLARDRGTTLSRTVTDLVRRGLGGGSGGDTEARYLGRHAVTGLPVVHLPSPLTTEDVRALDDDE